MDVEVGWWFTIARRSDGSAVAWGNNAQGQCNVPALPPGLTYATISAGGRHALALRSDGTVAAWGNNTYGECNVPPLTGNLVYTEVSAGNDFSLALRSDGSIVGWGASSYGQLQPPVIPFGLTYVGVAAGGTHGQGILSDGTLAGWGTNYNGEEHPPAPPSGWIYLDATAGHAQGAALLGPAPIAPKIYCTAKPNSAGCTPAISVVGIASASFGHGCTLRTQQLLTQKPGLYLHSTTGGQSQPFHGGLLCVQAPTVNHVASNTGAGTGTCGGALVEDLNLYIASGADPALGAGSTLWIQAWTRDPGDPFGDSLSDALEIVVSP